MNIYIRIEIRRRELEGRLLLAMAAAERGHEVLLGDLDALLSHRIWLRPGVFHDKSLTPSSGKRALHARLHAAGFLITSQDEEHGLGDPSYDAFARRRYANEMLERVHAAFCWGRHDHDALVARYPEHADRFRITGSPRVDLWRPSSQERHAGSPVTGVDTGRPVVLITPGSRPFLPSTFWATIADLRPRQFQGPDDRREWDQYEATAEAYRYVGRLVRAIRSLARAYPDVLFVVRPHPKSPDGAWEAVIGPQQNVVVTRDGDNAGAWLMAAIALIHNGSTTAAEAALSGVPVISFQPNGERAQRYTNRLGVVAATDEDLVRLVGDALKAPQDRSPTDADAQVIAERLSVDTDRLSADRIVDAWEEGDVPGLRRRNRARVALLTATLHRSAGRMRVRLRTRAGAGGAIDATGLDQTPKFPPIAPSELEGLVGGLQDGFARFRDVRARTLGGRLMHLRRG